MGERLVYILPARNEAERLGGVLQALVRMAPPGAVVVVDDASEDATAGVARAPDGLIEAVEAPGRRFEVGVQWHPAKLEDAPSRGLFRGFVAACAGS